MSRPARPPNAMDRPARTLAGAARPWARLPLVALCGCLAVAAGPGRRAGGAVAGAAADTSPRATRAEQPAATASGSGCDAAAGRLPRLDLLPPAELDRVIAEHYALVPDFHARLRALTLARVGMPYALGTLGEESPEDPDPVFRLDEADCTVLVLTTAALAHARSAREARAWMGPANYHRRGDGFPVRYDNRLHFTSDRLTASPMFEDLTSKLTTPDERRRVRLVLNRTAAGEPLLPIDWERPLEIAYVPAAGLEPVLARLPDLAGIAFVRESMIDRGLLVAHEGVLIDRRCLVHASSLTAAVVMVDVMDYLLGRDDPDPEKRGRARFDGALLYAFVDASATVRPAP